MNRKREEEEEEEGEEDRRISWSDITQVAE